MKPKNLPETPVAAQRLAWLINHKIEIRLHASLESFEAVYLDTIPVGHNYFFLLNRDDLRIMIDVSDVAQITDLPA